MSQVLLSLPESGIKIKLWALANSFGAMPPHTSPQSHWRWIRSDLRDCHFNMVDHQCHPIGIDKQRKTSKEADMPLQKSKVGPPKRFFRWRYGIVVCFLAACALWAIGHGQSALEDYPAKNADEQAIIKILRQYADAKGRFDLDAYLALLHPEGRFMLGGDFMVSKQEMAVRLPVFWNRLRVGDPSVFPLMRESLNGNFFTSGRFINPRIAVTGCEARVTVTFSKGFWHCDHDVSLRRKGGRWWIDGLDWEQR